jgi:hypothetical protein
VCRETVVHNGHPGRKNHIAHRMVARTQHSCQPPRTNRIRRSQFKISANTLMIMAKTLASTPINSDPFTYAEAIDSPQ